MAQPDKAVVSAFRFLDRDKAQGNNAAMLFDRAFQWHIETTKEKEGSKGGQLPRGDFELTEALPPELFPPCITIILNGLADGRKRAAFILVNFLRSVGYDYPAIEKMVEEWNKKNKEPLREVVWRGQVQYHKQQAKQALPPNCKNLAYMVAIGVCRPDNFCSAIKNPAQYAKKKAWLLARESKGRKKPKKSAGQESPASAHSPPNTP